MAKLERNKSTKEVVFPSFKEAFLPITKTDFWQDTKALFDEPIILRKAKQK